MEWEEGKGTLALKVLVASMATEQVDLGESAVLFCVEDVTHHLICSVPRDGRSYYATFSFSDSEDSSGMSSVQP